MKKRVAYRLVKIGINGLFAVGMVLKYGYLIFKEVQRPRKKELRAKPRE